MNILYKIIEIIPLRLRLQIFYFLKFKKKLNLNSPSLYSEKIQKRKLKLDPKYSLLSDKLAVKNNIKAKIGNEYIIPTIAFANSIDEIDFSLLPNSFVIKTNFGSGHNHIEIIKNKNNMNINNVLEKFRKAMSDKYIGSLLGESQYNAIPKKILIEKFIDNSGNDIDDFKFHIFNSKEGFLQIDFDRFSNHKRNLYDLNFNRLDYDLCYTGGTYNLPSKELLENMKNIAFKLSQDFDYVRVDLYLVNNKIYFGEMTFTPGSGFEKFTPSMADNFYGELWVQK